jgi:phage shock protein PspC (stress-responsive transcriptional regulator)
MTTTPPDTSHPEGSPDTGPGVDWDDIRDLGRLRRSRSDRKVAGVAGGLGRHLDIDPVILRVAFVVLTFFGGVGLLLYVALWLLLPEEGSDWAKIKLDRRSRTVALIIVGVLALLLLFSHGWWGGGGVGFLLFCLVVVLAAVVLSQALPRRGSRDAGTTPQPAAPTATVGDSTVAPPTTPYAAPYVPEQPRPVNPRKRGPILFWYSLAVMVVALGGLGIADLAGADVAPSAYPATVLAISALGLLVGSFYGRAGGLILVGLIAAPITAGTTIADHWDPHTTTVVPVSAAQLKDSYDMDVGEIVLDLTAVRDPENLDGRTVDVTGDVGHLDIEVPPGVTVVANTHVTGIGGINAFDRDGGGVDTQLTATHDAGPGAPQLVLDVDLHVGAIDVHTQPSTRSIR